MNSQALTVLFADLSDSTRLYQTQGDVRAHRKVSESLQCMRSAIERHGGVLLRTVGDSSLASFAETDAACEAAIAIQREHFARQLSVRVGFHFGEVIPDSGDLYGNTVNLAARVAEFAEANEICTTEQALARLSSSHRTSTHFLDTVGFKGISDPMSVYRVHWRTDSAQTAIVTGVSSIERKVLGNALELTVQERHLIMDANNPLVSFGRSANNDVIIDSRLASRNHATIELVRGRYLLSDSSTNGTYVLRAGAVAEFLRRDSVTLDRFGMISLGTELENEASHIIHFRVKVNAD